MYELLIVRHAIAHERDASSLRSRAEGPRASTWPNDDERPLTSEGIDKFRKAARGLLIAALLGGLDAHAAVEMKKGAVAQLAFAHRIEEGTGQLLALLPPRVLRVLGRKG